MKSIKPYWRLVENYISQNRSEVFRKIKALSNVAKAPLTFKETFRYLTSLKLRVFERFFLDVGLPSDIAFRLGNAFQNGDYDEVCDVLESFDSSEFLSNIGMMCLLEYGNQDVLYECRPTHLLDIDRYRGLFVYKYNDDTVTTQNRVNAFNQVMNVICKELGIGDICLVRHKQTSLDGRRIRISRGCKKITLDWPLTNVDHDDVNQILSKDYLATLENKVMDQADERGHCKSFAYLKKDSVDYLDEILFASINRNFEEIFKILGIDNDSKISKYKEKCKHS